MINMIACIDKNNGIGYKNKLLAYLPNDLRYFKEKTLNKIIVFGRTTYETLPTKPLRGRVNIVLSRESRAISGAIVYNCIDDILRINEEVFICGGSQIYEQFLPHANRLYITEINEVFNCDSYFPIIGDEWKEVSREKGLKDDKNLYDYDFVIYDRSVENIEK